MTNNWDKTLEPLMKMLLHKKGLQVRQSAEVGKKMVNIFRGKDFVEFLTNPANFNNILRRCPGVVSKLGASKDAISAEDAKKFGDALIAEGFMARAVAKVLKVAPAEESGKPQGEEKEGGSPTNAAASNTAHKRKKWPEKIVRLPLTEQQFEPTSLYIILYEGSKTMQHVFSFIAIAIVLIACMFPAWPIWAKIGSWYVAFWFAASMVSLLVVRMILFVCLWTVGVDFWLFPNILDEYAGVVDSFKPIYSIERRKDGYGMVAIRLVSMVVIGIATYEFFQHNSWEDIKNFAQNSINDILEWGSDKLTALPAPKNQYLSLADIERLADETSNTTSTTGIEESLNSNVVIDEDVFVEMQEF